ncbi:unnamed protein product [Rotaria sp. Silwood2]|nr:unnamed protein product [Rotaria sp. Silwood2]CAF4330298.1 unnamed protein product [Rotaria sp. Silwood2]
MSSKEWTLLHIAKSYEEAKDFATTNSNICQYGRSDLKSETNTHLNAANTEDIHYVHLKLKLLWRTTTCN